MATYQGSAPLAQDLYSERVPVYSTTLLAGAALKKGQVVSSADGVTVAALGSNTPYGVALEDAASGAGVAVGLSGEFNKNKLASDASGTALTAAQIVALRAVGIYAVSFQAA